MAERLFAAVLPPAEVVAALEGMVEPRRDDAWRWVDPSAWHVTLAFYESVEPWRSEPLVANLAEVARRTRSFPLSFEGVGCFGSVARAHVLFAETADVTDSLPPLADRCRTAATTVGVEVARSRFHPHLTLARRNRGSDATKHVRALGELSTPEWQVTEVALVESFLGQGPGGTPRYVVQERFSLDGGSA